VAAHITAAIAGGPRYKETLSKAERTAAENGIWLCQNCAKLVDNDPSHYTVELLQSWKSGAEDAARAELEGTHPTQAGTSSADLMINWRKVDIRSKRHEYRLEVIVHNVGATVLREYHVDVEMPTAVLIDRTGAVADRSDGDKTVFRMVWQGAADDIFPEDKRVVLILSYCMDTKLFWRRDNFFDRMVRATLYCGGRRLVVVERRFEEFQCF